MSHGKKSVEIELKLLLPTAEAESTIVTFLRDHGYRVEEIPPVHNVDTYLDTFEWSLMKNKLALRYRVSDGMAMYTLKSLGSIRGGIAKRMETEVPLKEPVAIPSAVPVKRVRRDIEALIYPRKLLEQLQIRTDRRRYRVVSPEEAKIELAFDISSFSLRGLHKGRRTQRLHELEAEILDGPATALGSLAALFSQAFAYRTSSASKFEVAIERLKVAMPSKKPPEKLKVHLEDRLDLALRKILTYQLQRFREQLPGVHGDIDTEFVHQARVATRRMRSALRLLRDAVPGNTGAYLAGELKWLGGMFGPVRDLDVFLLNVSRFQGQIKHFPGKKKKALEDWIEEQRRAPLKALQAALESPRYKTFERRLGGFLEKPLPARPRAPLAVKPVGDIAPAAIQEKWAAVLTQGNKVLAKPTLKRFHRLRVQMKKLRYATEFMGPAYDGTLAPFIDRTVEIQNCLGELQDTVFTSGFIQDLLDHWKGKLVDPDLIFIFGEVYQLQGEIARQRQEMFSKIWERFSSEETIRLLKEILMAPSHSRAAKTFSSLPSFTR